MSGDLGRSSNWLQTGPPLFIMDDIKITRARGKDRPYIEEKLQKYALDSTNIEWNQFFVAKNNERAFAFGRVVDHGDFLEIVSLGVDYYHRKKGIGKELLLFLIKEARKIDSEKPLYAISNLVDFFKKFGFEKIDIFPDYLGKKRKRCLLDESQIAVMKYRENKST